MILAKVLKQIVSTVKDESFRGRPIFVVQPVDQNLTPLGSIFLAFDHVKSGEGDIVLICREGNGCRQMWGASEAPVNAVIAGIVDQLAISSS